MAEPLLSVHGLCVEFPVRAGVLQRVTGVVRAVDDVSFELARGETLGLVGESGSGKSTVGRALLRLIEPTRGTVRFNGVDVRAASGEALRRLRREMQVVFQDPSGSLNPRLRVGDTIAEPLRVHGVATSTQELRTLVAGLLEKCGMPADAAQRYPHQFSGGQRQRIAIARALALRPRLIVCDEPTSALDVSIQAQIINLLTDLQAEFGLSYLFISHDMNVIQHVCRRIAVMHRGRIVETGERDQILSAPTQEYTRNLLRAVPRAPMPVSA